MSPRRRRPDSDLARFDSRRSRTERDRLHAPFAAPVVDNPRRSTTVAHDETLRALDAVDHSRIGAAPASRISTAAFAMDSPEARHRHAMPISDPSDSIEEPD
jgi:hypothetical protein